MTKSRRMFTEEQEKIIIELYFAGEPADSLGKIYGSKKAVWNVLKRAGISSSDRAQKEMAYR